MRPNTPASSLNLRRACSADRGSSNHQKVQGAAAEQGVTPSRDFSNLPSIVMTPLFQPSSSYAQTGKLLRLIYADTRRQLRRWIVLSLFLRCSPVLTPAARRAMLIVARDAVAVLHAMRICARDANRHFRKHRFDRCLQALDRFNRLLRVLKDIDRKAGLTILTSICKRGRHGRGH